MNILRKLNQMVSLKHPGIAKAGWMRFGMRADPKLGPRFCCFDEILVVYMGELLGNQEKHHPGQSPEVEIRSKKTPDPGPSKTILD